MKKFNRRRLQEWDNLIRDYIGVDLWAVWGGVENILPSLKTQIEDILRKEKGQ